MDTVHHYLTTFHIGAASGWDLLMILIFIVAILLYGSFLGRNRIVIFILSTYLSWAIIQVLPWQRLADLGGLGMTGSPSASLKIFVFLGIILLISFFMPRSILSSALRIRAREDATWIQVFILSILQLGLLATIILSLLPAEAIADIAPLIKRAFIGSEPEFVWLTLPILAMIFMRRRRPE